MKVPKWLNPWKALLVAAHLFVFDLLSAISQLSAIPSSLNAFYVSHFSSIADLTFGWIGGLIAQATCVAFGLWLLEKAFDTEEPLFFYGSIITLAALRCWWPDDRIAFAALIPILLFLLTLHFRQHRTRKWFPVFLGTVALVVWMLPVDWILPLQPSPSTEKPSLALISIDADLLQKLVNAPDLQTYFHSGTLFPQAISPAMGPIEGWSAVFNAKSPPANRVRTTPPSSIESLNQDLTSSLLMTYRQQGFRLILISDLPDMRSFTASQFFDETWTAAPNIAGALDWIWNSGFLRQGFLEGIFRNNFQSMVRKSLRRMSGTPTLLVIQASSRKQNEFFFRNLFTEWQDMAPTHRPATAIFSLLGRGSPGEPPWLPVGIVSGEPSLLSSSERQALWISLSGDQPFTQQTVGLIDVLPSFVPSSASSAPREGQSLRPLLQGQPLPSRFFYSESGIWSHPILTQPTPLIPARDHLFLIGKTKGISLKVEFTPQLILQKTKVLYGSDQKWVAQWAEGRHQIFHCPVQSPCSHADTAPDSFQTSLRLDEERLQATDDWWSLATASRHLADHNFPFVAQQLDKLLVRADVSDEVREESISLYRQLCLAWSAIDHEPPFIKATELENRIRTPNADFLKDLLKFGPCLKSTTSPQTANLFQKIQKTIASFQATRRGLEFLRDTALTDEKVLDEINQQILLGQGSTLKLTSEELSTMPLLESGEKELKTIEVLKKRLADSDQEDALNQIWLEELNFNLTTRLNAYMTFVFTSKYATDPLQAWNWVLKQMEKVSLPPRFEEQLYQLIDQQKLVPWKLADLRRFQWQAPVQILPPRMVVLEHAVVAMALANRFCGNTNSTACVAIRSSPAFQASIATTPYIQWLSKQTAN